MTIAFLGAGNIAQAILGGMLQSGTDPASIVAADPFDETRQKVEAMGVRTVTSNAEAAAGADTVIICVKPNIVVEALQSLDGPHDGKLFVSVAAGVTSATIIDALGGHQNVVRCMPNTPALVKEGMTALHGGSGVAMSAREVASTILGAVGSTLWVNNESDLDAVTAVSGSGPAYFFYLMESMIKAGEAEGLSYDVAKQLVVQTALGSARMVMEQSAEPAELRHNVTSPGGTTQAAIESFQASGLEESVRKAVNAARTRSVELSAS